MKEKDYKYSGYNSELLTTAKMLRKTLTRQERHLWYDFLKTYPIKIYKQRPIATYIVDFFCSKAKLVIEIDGAQHYTEDGLKYDENRSMVLKELGIEVIRFSNYDVDTNFEGVCMEIDKEIKKRLHS